MKFLIKGVSFFQFFFSISSFFRQGALLVKPESKYENFLVQLRFFWA